MFEPLDFIARLAALVPKPRVHLTRFHGVFAPNSKHRAAVTGEVKKKKKETSPEASDGVEARRTKMNWAMRLKRVFNIDVTVCRHCQSSVRIIACIEEQLVINKILAHMEQKKKSQTPANISSGIRAPPTVLHGQPACRYN